MTNLYSVHLKSDVQVRLARWIYFLAEYELKMAYKPEPSSSTAIFSTRYLKQKDALKEEKEEEEEGNEDLVVAVKDGP